MLLNPCFKHASLPPTEAFQMCRFQYLELAYYLTHGKCINIKDPGDSGWMILQSGVNFTEYERKDHDHSGFSEFLKSHQKCSISRGREYSLRKFASGAECTYPPASRMNTEYSSTWRKR